MATPQKVDIELSGNQYANIEPATNIKNGTEKTERAVHFYIEEREKQALIEEMAKGYEEMGKINLSLCEEFFASEAEVCYDS